MINGISLDFQKAAELLPCRAPFSHKGSFGRVLLICGSKNMIGCCVLAAEGALRSGAGLVTLAFPDSLYLPLTSRLTENLFYPVDSEGGFISEKGACDLVRYALGFDAVLVGCGIGVTDSTKALVKGLVENVPSLLILDADALNCLCSFKEALLKRKGEVLLTPHPGEMARLIDSDVCSVEKERKKVIVGFSREFNVNMLLKGHETLICNSSADKLYINSTGNTGLSKGGAGDLLSGIITGLAPSMKGNLFETAALGAFIHGLTADILKEECSEFSMLPSDCAKGLNKAFKKLEEFSEN